MLLMLLTACLAAAPGDLPNLSPPRLQKGDELVYLGEVVEAGEEVGNRFRKRHELEVRLFVLESEKEFADCALMTVLRPTTDPIVTQGGAVTDTKRIASAASVQLDLIRVDTRGRITMLNPPAGPPPLPLHARTEILPFPVNPMDAPPRSETGFLIPLPTKLVTTGESWAVTEPARPPILWTISGEAVWNGGRFAKLSATQQTDGWGRPAVTVTGWNRTETLLVAPADGFASSVHRRIERREGSSIVGWVEVNYTLQPPRRHIGRRYEDVRHEIEMAYGYGAEVDALLTQGLSRNQHLFALRRIRLDQFLQDRFIVPTGFRVAVEALSRRCEAAAEGKLLMPLTTPIRKPSLAETIAVGKPAPDFVAPFVDSSKQFHLASERGTAALLVFYKPGSPDAEETLGVMEALSKHFGKALSVTALTVDEKSEPARRERDRLRFTVPIAEGIGLRARYGIDYYPRFFLIDPQGVLVWQFEGFGGEVGYLAKNAVRKILK